MDVMLLAGGAGSGITGAVLGRFLATRRRRIRYASPRKAVCGCRHHRSFHKNGTGSCYHDAWFTGTRCTCQVYTGPVPLPEYYSPEIGE
jgi:hypothetical protein